MGESSKWSDCVALIHLRKIITPLPNILFIFQVTMITGAMSYLRLSFLDIHGYTQTGLETRRDIVRTPVLLQTFVTLSIHKYDTRNPIL